MIIQNVTGLEQLTDAEYQVFMHDLQQAAHAIYDALTPALINYASLGNVIPHLHFHIIPRYEQDVRFGKPIWTTDEKDMVEHFLTADEWVKLKQRLMQALLA